MGVGTTSGVRIVVGMWDRSPFGPFTDVFLELPDSTSVLLAPDEIVAAYVSGTYRFDTVSVVDVRARRTAGGLELSAGALQASIDVGASRRSAGSCASSLSRSPATRAGSPRSTPWHGCSRRGPARRGRRATVAASTTA